MLEGKVALITGAGRGIGQACALELAAAGCDIAFCDIEENASETIQGIESHGRRAYFHRTDIGKRAEVEKLFRSVQSAFGRLDILVNNAVVNVRKPFLDLEVGDVQKTWDVLLWGLFHCSQLAARRMVAQGSGGTIIIIGSVHADRPYPLCTSYNGAKAAANQMAKTWAGELAPHRIRVNVVEPGWTDTAGERNFYTEEQIKELGSQLPLGRLAYPREIGAAVKYLVSPDAEYVTGSVLRVDGGFVLPR